MEITLDIPFEQLIQIIRRLSDDQKKQLRAELDAHTPANNDPEAFRKFLLNFPVMTDEEYQNFQENRKSFNKWTEE